MVAAIALIAVGCGSGSDASPSTTARVAQAASTAVVVVDDSSPEETSPPPAATQGESTTTTIDRVDACAAFIPIAAFLGDVDASNMWSFIGQDASRLDELCDELAMSDPSLVDDLAEQFAEYSATSVAPEPATTHATTRPTIPPTVAPAPPPPPAGMPFVLCMNLQDAQDLIQSVTGVFFSRSFDATGAGRSQIIDSNWIVVSQDPEPGTPVGEGDAVLGVVKYGEPSLC
jgi:hypothetical protein